MLTTKTQQLIIRRFKLGEQAKQAEIRFAVGGVVHRAIGHDKGDAMTRQQVIEILHDPAISFWLKEAIQNLSQRDPVDAIADAELLLKTQEARFNGNEALY